MVVQEAAGRYYYATTTGIYNVVLSGNLICSNTSSGINVIKPCNLTPAFAEAGADKRICIADSAFIKGSVSGTAKRASWSGGNGLFIPNKDSLEIIYVPTAAEVTAGKLKLYLTGIRRPLLPRLRSLMFPSGVGMGSGLGGVR